MKNQENDQLTYKMKKQQNDRFIYLDHELNLKHPRRAGCERRSDALTEGCFLEKVIEMPGDYIEKIEGCFIERNCRVVMFCTHDYQVEVYGLTFEMLEDASYRKSLHSCLKLEFDETFKK